MLNVGAFDLDRALAVDKGFLEPEYPFEWAGVFELGAGKVRFSRARKVRTSITHGTSMLMRTSTSRTSMHERTGGDARLSALARTARATSRTAICTTPASTSRSCASPAANADELNKQIEPALRAFAETPIDVPCGGHLEMGAKLFRLDVGHEGADFTLDVNEPGAYAVFCEHVPAEFALRFEGLKPVAERQFASHHHHDEEITSIGISRSARRSMAASSMSGSTT